MIFKTSVLTQKDLNYIGKFLNDNALIKSWFIDIDDCDKVLKAESDTLTEQNVIEFMGIFGFDCAEL